MERERARALLRRWHEAQGAFYAGGEEAPLLPLLANEITWSVPGTNAIAGQYHGIDEVLAYFRRRRELARHSMRMYPGDVLVGEGDHVAVLTDGTAVLGGVEHRWSTVGLYRFAGELLAACWLLPLDQRSFDAIWRG
jgi:hypothetical protein